MWNVLNNLEAEALAFGDPGVPVPLAGDSKPGFHKRAEPSITWPWAAVRLVVRGKGTRLLCKEG